MDEARLKKLLQDADRPPRGEIPRDMAARVRRSATIRTRERNRRLMTIGVILVLCVGAVASRFLLSGNKPQAQASHALSAPASSHVSSGIANRSPKHPPLPNDLVLEAYLGQQLKPRKTSDVLPPDPVAELREQRDMAACTMVAFANRVLANADRAAAIQQYEGTIKLFPETTWAQIARDQLIQIRRRPS